MKTALPSRSILLSRSRRAAGAGFALVEALVYISVVCVVLGVAFVALYRSIDHTRALRRNADDITRALHAGERWRADVRAAATRIWTDPTNTVLHLDGPRGKTAYRFDDDAVCRRVGDGPWVRLLPNVKSSVMEPDRRQKITAWRWELEFKPQITGAVKPGRVRPLFTFLAVPPTTVAP
jgi:hypothetical protein